MSSQLQGLPPKILPSFVSPIMVTSRLVAESSTIVSDAMTYMNLLQFRLRLAIKRTFVLVSFYMAAEASSASLLLPIVTRVQAKACSEEQNPTNHFGPLNHLEGSS